VNNVYFWSTVIPLSLGTLCIRLSFIFFSKLKISKELEKLFSYIPAAVLPALFTPMVIFHKTNPDFLFDYKRTVAFIVGAGFCFYSKNILLTILVGLISLFLINKI
jgi:branched-subunit amino acid transport protein